MIVSPDHFLYAADGTYEWTPAGLVSAWKQTEARVKDLLLNPLYKELWLLVGLPGAGKTTWLRDNQVPGRVYVDATFATAEDRAVFVQIGAQSRRPVMAVWLDTPFEVCTQRNSKRSADRLVPNGVLTSMQAKLAATPPSCSEGFYEVLVVR